ncbi:MAG: hypothetical protein ABH877_04405 [bacterium]
MGYYRTKPLGALPVSLQRGAKGAAQSTANTSTAVPLPNLVVRINGVTVTYTPSQAVAAGYEWVPATLLSAGHWQKKTAPGGDRATVTSTKSGRTICSERAARAGRPDAAQNRGWLNACAAEMDNSCARPGPGVELSNMELCITNVMNRHPFPAPAALRDKRLDAFAAQCIAAGVQADQVQSCAEAWKSSGAWVEDGILVGADGQAVQQGGAAVAPKSNLMLFLLLGGGAVAAYLFITKGKKRGKK